MMGWNVLANLIGMAVAIGVQAGMAFGGYRLAGAEQYGLIGFFSTLMVAASIFDTGLGQTVTRAVAQDRESKAGKTAGLVFNFGLVYLLLAIFIILATALASPLIARYWLKPQHIPIEEVQQAVVLMGAAIGIQRYRGVLQSTLEGLERQVLSNLLLSATGLVRLALGLGALAFIAPTAQAFFWSQIVASVIETSTFALVVVKVVPGALSQRPNKTLIWGSLRFASVNVAAAATGTLVQIADSLVISAMLPLAVFGTYSLISTMCSAMVRLCTPLITASFPRMSAHAHAGRAGELRNLFFTISQATFVLLLSAAGALIFFGSAFLELVSGKPEVGLQYALVLAALAIAYALSGLCRPSHALLMSEGDASTALKINIVCGVLYLPAILILTPRYGVIVPATCLIGANLLAFVLFTASAFKRLLRGVAWPWLATSVAPQILAVTAGCLAVRLTMRGDVGLWPHLALAVAGSGLAFILGAAASDHLRPLVASAVRRKA